MVWPPAAGRCGVARGQSRPSRSGGSCARRACWETYTRHHRLRGSRPGTESRADEGTRAPVARIGHDILDHETEDGPSSHRHPLGHGGVERNDRRAVANDIEPCNTGRRREELPLEVSAVPGHMRLDEVDEREELACVVGLSVPHRYVGIDHRPSLAALPAYSTDGRRRQARAACAGTWSRTGSTPMRGPASCGLLTPVAARAYSRAALFVGARRECTLPQWPQDDLIRPALAPASEGVRVTAAPLV